MQSYNINIDANTEKQRLDNYLLSIFSLKTRSNIKVGIERGNYLVNGNNVKSGYKLKIGDIITVIELEPTLAFTKPEEIDIEVLYEDEDIAIINKKQGMVVHPANGNHSGTLVNALLSKLNNLSSINGVIRPGIVHRIDKNTSGLLVVAKNDFAHVSLQKQIQNKTCKRFYKAVVIGHFKSNDGVIETYIGRNPKDRKKMAVVSSKDGKLAITNYKVLESYNGFSLCEFELKTGRTHQIRVHCQSLGHPILGDDVYGGINKNFPLNGQLLHAYKLVLIHPKTNKEMIFTSELPDYFEKTIEKLRNN